MTENFHGQSQNDNYHKLIAQLPRVIEIDSASEERTVAALKAKGMLHAKSSGRRGLVALAIAATILAAVLSGGGYGRLASLFAQRPDTLVRVAGAPIHTGVATLVEELSIGTLNGAAEYTFGRIFDIAAAGDGSIYVHDNLNNIIRRYNAAGQYLNSFGRAGEGPGEVMSSGGIRVLPNGQVALYDSKLNRINIYSATGQTLRQIPVPGSGGTVAHRAGFEVDTAGFAYALRTTVTTVPDGTGRMLIEPRDAWLRINLSSGAVVDTIHEPEWRSRTPEPFRATNSRGWRQMAVPFLPRRIMTISTFGYAITGESERYAFEMLMSPRRVVSVRRNIPAAEVTSAEYNAARNRIENGMREVDPLWSWGGRDVPRTKPYYEGINVGRDGRIWITREITPLPQVRPPSQGRSGGGASTSLATDEPFVARPSLYDVFEADGAWVGQVQAPPNVTLMTMRGDQVWGTFRGEDDVEFVRKYRIAWPR